MRNAFLIFIILTALVFSFGGCGKKYDAVAGKTLTCWYYEYAYAYSRWANENITWEGDTRYTITIYVKSSPEAWIPLKFTDVTKYNCNTGTLVFQTTREVVRFSGNYTIGK